MVPSDNISQPTQTQKRKRGILLSVQGWQRLQAAQHLSAARDNASVPYTLEQLSDRTGLSTKTLTKVRRRQQPVDQPTLASYFEAFGLTLRPDDYVSQEPDADVPQRILTDLLQAPLKGQLALGSPFYIYRSPVEQLFMQEVLQPGALIRVRGPRQYGKTSLVAMGLNQAEEQQFRTAVLSLQMADRTVFSSLNQFLQWFCVMVGRSLGLPNRLEELWNPLFGSSYSCNEYFESYLLPAIDTPLLLVLDEANVLFNYPEIAADFFGMLRAWYERSRHSLDSNYDLWQKLRLVIVYSTEVFLPLNVHQSPFNVGLLIELQPFTPQQVQELTLSYGIREAEAIAPELSRLLGGNPYLTQLALFHLSQNNVVLSELLATVTTPVSIFDSHLRQQLSYLDQHPELKAAMQQVVASPTGAELHPFNAFKLQGMGLVTFRQQMAVASCELYQKYFAHVLGV